MQKIKNYGSFSVAETAFHDQWQRCEIGIATVNSDGAHARSSLQTLINTLIHKWIGDFELLKHTIDVEQY